jgi:hypothetical protein
MAKLEDVSTLHVDGDLLLIGVLDDDGLKVDFIAYLDGWSGVMRGAWRLEPITGSTRTQISNLRGA